MRYVALMVVMLGVRPADACLCLPSDRIVMPAEGALGVPTNPLFVVATTDERAPEVTCAPRATCNAPSSSGCAVGGEPGWLVLLALSRGWSRRSARRHPTRAPRPAP